MGALPVRPLQHTRFMLVIHLTAKKQSDKRWRSILSIVQTVVHSVLRLPMSMVMNGQQDQSHWSFGCRRLLLLTTMLVPVQNTIWISATILAFTNLKLALVISFVLEIRTG